MCKIKMWHCDQNGTFPSKNCPHFLDLFGLTAGST
jgi:hypothetical protein